MMKTYERGYKLISLQATIMKSGEAFTGDKIIGVWVRLFSSMIYVSIKGPVFVVNGLRM